jgi:hypothetical protein
MSTTPTVVEIELSKLKNFFFTTHFCSDLSHATTDGESFLASLKVLKERLASHVEATSAQELELRSLKQDIAALRRILGTSGE